MWVGLGGQTEQERETERERENERETHNWGMVFLDSVSTERRWRRSGETGFYEWDNKRLSDGSRVK